MMRYGLWWWGIDYEVNFWLPGSVAGTEYQRGVWGVGREVDRQTDSRKQGWGNLNVASNVGVAWQGWVSALSSQLQAQPKKTLQHLNSLDQIRGSAAAESPDPIIRMHFLARSKRLEASKRFCSGAKPSMLPGRKEAAIRRSRASPLSSSRHTLQLSQLSSHFVP